MKLAFHAIEEARPGEKWLALFQRHWPAYRRWFLSQGDADRPSFLETRRQFRRHMPELADTYEELVEIGGGTDLLARFLGHYCPPPYISGCSQAVWSASDGPRLVRNYDYSPSLCEGTLLSSRWNQRRVMAMGDCLWGVLDGINDAGLCLSLAFGGRRVVGRGFGMPVILRYVLECCDNVAEAVEALGRIPTHMSYNITVLDAAGACCTVHLSPDRPPLRQPLAVATNHQRRVEWRRHAEATASEERERFLHRRLAAGGSAEDFQHAFLAPPLYASDWARGFGTLYSASYQPAVGRMSLYWPGAGMHQAFDGFTESVRTVHYPRGAPRPGRRPGKPAVPAAGGPAILGTAPPR